ncbi:type VII secretion system-associated protein [Streptomyces canus]|uniref:type VII secretion system-associated protein n=1 Tax=Streptomyces canus TaxID=58343 RepID=UPI0036ECBC08
MGWGKSFTDGFGEAGPNLLKTAVKTDPFYALVNPADFLKQTTTTLDGLVWGAQNPKEFAKAATDWDTSRTNPARALGHLGPDVVVELLPGGVGGVATKASAAARRSTHALEEGAEAAQHAAGAARHVEDAADAARKLGPDDPRSLPAADRNVDVDSIRNPVWREGHEPLYRNDNRHPSFTPVTEALRAQAAGQRGGYVYAIDPYFDADGAVPPYGIVGGWSVDDAGQLVAFSHNPNYRPSPVALEFPAPPTALDAAMQKAVTGYAGEEELLSAFREATLMLFAQEGQQGLYTVVDDDGTRYVPPSPTLTTLLAPGTWHHGSPTRRRGSPGPAQPRPPHQPDDPRRGAAADGQPVNPAHLRTRRQGLPGAEQSWAFAERSAKVLNTIPS